MALAFYGSFISLIQTYWIGRLFSHKILEHSFYKRVEEYVEKMKGNSFKFVFIGCASPFIPNDIICYAAGLIKYHFGKFMAA